MLSKAVPDVPEGDDFFYEPKWDGFRSIVFRDGEDVELGSRNERPLTRYFPELVDPLRAALPDRCVVDGEIVIAGPDGLDFDALLQRIHPAESRVRLLAEQTPASIVAFDVLAIGDEDLRDVPFVTRRQRLEDVLARARPPVHLTPATRDRAVAVDWFSRFEGAGLDGVVAKQGSLLYRPGERTMFKIKHQRTADCVVAGFRTHKSGDGVGSLLLGLFDEHGTLHHVGVTSAFTAKRRRELVDELAPYRWAQGDVHPWLPEPGAAPQGRVPGGVSRWTGKRDLSWEVLRPELVCEVRYDQLQGDRFRHATTFARWRPDRTPASCNYAQLDVAVPAELDDVFAGGR